MHRLLIFGRTVSIISIISMGEMLNGFKMLEVFFSVSAFSIIYLSWLKLIFKFGIFSKAIFAGSSASSSLIIIFQSNLSVLVFWMGGAIFWRNLLIWLREYL